MRKGEKRPAHSYAPPADGAEVKPPLAPCLQSIFQSPHHPSKQQLARARPAPARRRNTMRPQNQAVVGVFSNQAQARLALQELRDAGFTEQQLGLVTPSGGDGGWRGETSDPDTNWEEGAGAGAATGAALGGLWAVGIAAGALPAIGPIIAGGVLASVLASALGGAAVGGVVGALIGLGLSEDEARGYEDEFKAGRTLITVQAPGRFAEAVGILRRNGGFVRDDYAEINAPHRSATPTMTATEAPMAPPVPMP